MIINKIIDEDVKGIIDDNNGLMELKDSSFLITGASGMVGSYFVYTLMKLNEEYNYNIDIILVVRNKNKLLKDVVENEKVIIVEQDICDPLAYEGAVDYIVHAASPASPLIMKEKPVETNFANTIGTANTLKFAHSKKAKSYMFVSSREIYGQPDEGQEQFSEYGRYGQVDPLEARNGYAEGKKAAENMCVGYREEYNLNTKIARLAHTYGPGMSIYDGRVQADFLKNVFNDEDIVLKSEGASIRTYTYIADSISAMFAVLLYSKDFVYNIADEENRTSIRELAEVMVSIEPEKNLKLVFDIPQAPQKGVAAFTSGILSTDKIRKELAWKPKYSIKEGFARTLEYLRIEANK